MEITGGLKISFRSASPGHAHKLLNQAFVKTTLPQGRNRKKKETFLETYENPFSILKLYSFPSDAQLLGLLA